MDDVTGGPASTVTAERTEHLRYAATPGDVPTGTLVELFLRAVDEIDKPDALVYRTADGWQPMSHRDVLERVHRICDALIADGVQRGERIALLSENRPEWALADYALICAGALTVPVYATLPADQIVYLMQHAKVETVFVSTSEQLAKMLEVRRTWPRIRRIVVFDDVKTTEPGVTTLRAFEELGGVGSSENEFRQRALLAKPGDVATVVYTSGTTGTPKGVMLTHDNLVSNVHAALGEIQLGPADVALSFMPLSHVLQRMVDYVMFGQGVTIAHLSSIDDAARAFREVRPTFAVAVPRVYEKVYARVLSVPGLRRRLVLWARRVALKWADTVLAGRRPGHAIRVQHALADRLVYRKIRESLGGRIRFFVSGSAPLAHDVASFFYGAGLLILEGYGLTETSPVTNVNMPSQMRIGTVGKPVPGTEIRIADDGEILVRGRQVMKGYYRDEEASAAVLDSDGWLHTGDIGEIDVDGFLRITDRKKELLKTAGGKYIAPQPIENEVKRSRYVAEAIVLGDRRPFPIVVVVPNFDTLNHWARQHDVVASSAASLVADPRVTKMLEREVARRIDHFARHEKPKKVLILPGELSVETGEITPSLKVKRRVVEKRYADRIEALYAEPPPAERG